MKTRCSEGPLKRVERWAPLASAQGTSQKGKYTQRRVQLSLTAITATKVTSNGNEQDQTRPAQYRDTAVRPSQWPMVPRSLADSPHRSSEEQQHATIEKKSCETR
jgi:hypothetical protein